MFIIFIVVLLGLGDCTPGDVVGEYRSDRDPLDDFKSNAYGVENDFLEEYKGYDDGYNNRDGHDGKKDDQLGNEEYGYKDFDVREYDYVQKCDVNVKDCKDGRNCYDKASNRSRYDSCKNQYGDEGRYYNIDDRYSGNTYREEDYDDHYDKECFYDDYNNSYERAKCRNNKNVKKYDKYSYVYNNNLVGLGRRDREDQLFRPCALDDRQCIRNYMAQNSKCKPAYGPIPDPLYLKRNTVYFPLANLTFMRTRVRVIGLASIKISEFYVNKLTNNLVIALDFKKLNQTSPKIYFRYQRTAKESIVLEDFASDEYQSGTFTAVIPKIPQLRLDLAEVHADMDDLVPRVIIGPRAVNEDPDVIASAAIFLANLPLMTQEFFLFTSQLYTSIYIQESICDFGLKLTKV